MRLVRGLLAVVVWLLAIALGLVALLLCVSVILLPVGLPLLSYSRRLFGLGVRLMLSRKATHPVDELRKRLAVSHG